MTTARLLSAWLVGSAWLGGAIVLASVADGQAPAPMRPAGPADNQPATIAATGHASESRSPDQAEVSMGVQATGKTSAEAQDALNKAMEKVIKAVKDAGLAGLMVQTQ